MGIQISVPTSLFQTELRRSIEQAMRIGAQGVQFDLRTEVTSSSFGDSARRQILHFLTERSLKLASAFFPLKAPLVDPGHLDRRLAALNGALQTAASLKVRTFILRPGSIPPKGSAEWETLVQILGDLASQGDRLGVTLCLQPDGESAEELKELVASVKSGLITIDADPAEWVLAGRNPTHELRNLFGHIGHFEGRDAARGAARHGREVPVGQGEIDWNEVAALLQEMNYIRWVNVQRTEGTHRVEDVAMGVKVLGNLFSRGAMFSG